MARSRVIMIALLSLAMAVDHPGDSPGFDPAPGVSVPSSAPGPDMVEARVGAGVRRFLGRTSEGLSAEVQLRYGRLAAGVDVIGAPGDGAGLPLTTGWVGVAVVNRSRLKVTPFVRGGLIVQPGLSVVARTRGGGIGGNDFTIDLAWGPAFSVERLTQPSWDGPFDLLHSLPEAGFTLPLHPNGSQQLRVGTMGGVPMATWRYGKRYFVMESSLGVAPYGGIANFTIGSRFGATRSLEAL